MKNIEDLNRIITDCRMLDHHLKQEYNTTQPVIHQEMVNDVIEHRRIWGLTSMFTILRQIVKTKKYCYTIK
jgi:hypothetical protein